MRLTAAQKLWLYLQIQQDDTEHYEQLKYLFMHIRPEAYKKEISGTEISSNMSTDFLGDVATKLNRELTPDEQLALTTDLENSDIDTIERVY